MKTSLHFNVLTSAVFSVGAPLVMKEILSRGHELTTYVDQHTPDMNKLLACDVFIDLSAITEPSFYECLQGAIETRRLSHKPIPLLVDPPAAIINSIDKRRTHALFPELVPESYSLDGLNNAAIFLKFKGDEYVIVKEPCGWGGTGVNRLSPQEASREYKKASGLIIQRYLPAPEGVGRIVTINYSDDFVIAASYTRYSKTWRTGVDVQYECLPVAVTPELLKFAHHIAVKSGLYLNGIDYIKNDNGLHLLEVNAVPAMGEVIDNLGINIPRLLLEHIERNV